MRRQFFLLLGGLALPSLAMALFGPGCGSSVSESEGTGGAGGVGAAGGPASSSTYSGPGPGGYDGGHDALNDYHDPGCPDAGPPIYDYQCDPYNQGNGDCLATEACYIYVDYPSEPCGQETYGSLCARGGFGQQGDPCSSPLDCAPGHVCVITGSGTQCVHLCSLAGDDGCPPGLVCEAIDVEGFGGCL